jgi:hypothetical protein
MIGMVMFGEGNKKLQQEKAQAANPAVEQPAAETPPPPSAPATPAVTP